MFSSFRRLTSNSCSAIRFKSWCSSLSSLPSSDCSSADADFKLFKIARALFLTGLSWMIWTLLSFLFEVTCWAEGVFLFATFFRSRMVTYFWGFDLLCCAASAPTCAGTSSWKHSFSSISNSAILFFSQKLSSGSSHMEDSSWMCGVWVEDALSDNTIIADTVSFGTLTLESFSIWADGGTA